MLGRKRGEIGKEIVGRKRETAGEIAIIKEENAVEVRINQAGNETTGTGAERGGSIATGAGRGRTEEEVEALGVGDNEMSGGEAEVLDIGDDERTEIEVASLFEGGQEVEREPVGGMKDGEGIVIPSIDNMVLELKKYILGAVAQAEEQPLIIRTLSATYII